MTSSPPNGFKSRWFPSTFTRSRNWRLVFLLSIIFRTYFSLSPSYIHPDEHFQGPEAIADQIFGWSNHSSWEFTSEFPIRSYLCMWLIYGLPMSFLKVLFTSRLKSVDPSTVYYSLRAIFAIGTWILSDMAIDRLSVKKQDRIKGLLFVATSYVTWTYQSHTFSNSVETVVLLWCLVIMYELKTKRSNAISRHWDTGLLAVLIVFGIFNRVTFPAYLLLPSFHMLKYFYRFPFTFITFACTGLITVMLAIQFDTMLYNHNGKVPEQLSDLVITPLNNFLYNSRIENLSAHGLHYNFHHILVNLPELLGPGLIFLFSTKYFKTLQFQSALSGILCLSLVPHQEVRFLIPAVPLLCQCFDYELFKTRKMLKSLLSIWLVFNIVLGIIIGILHQGGVIPAQFEISRIAKTTPINTVIWWKTYSPPIWLLGKPLNTVEIIQPDETCSDYYEEIMNRISAHAEYLNNYDNNRLEVNQNYENDKILVIDLMGADENSVLRVLDHIFKFSLQPNALFVSSIASVQTTQGIKQLTESNKTAYHLEPIWSTRFHVSLENLYILKLESLIPGLTIWTMQ